jgi:hypothetical protein
MTQQVTPTTMVDQMQSLIEEIKADKKLGIEKRVKLITACADRQLRAGALWLAWQRAASRMPDEAARIVPVLNSPDRPDPAALKQ